MNDEEFLCNFVSMSPQLKNRYYIGQCLSSVRLFRSSEKKLSAASKFSRAFSPKIKDARQCLSCSCQNYPNTSQQYIYSAFYSASIWQRRLRTRGTRHGRDRLIFRCSKISVVFTEFNCHRRCVT